AVSDSSSYIQLPLGRFNDAYSRMKDEDRLVDYIIVLESLLLSGGEMSEMSYRLGLRAAHLLAKSAEDRERIFETVKAAYDLRSRVVHGNEPTKKVKIGKEEYALKDVVPLVEDVSRRVLTYFCKNYPHTKNKDSIEEIDRRILRGEQRKSDC
ncbi:MAG: hypothetical protein ACXQT1_01510, partial [Methermicoccaceae archaeon]